MSPPTSSGRLLGALAIASISSGLVVFFAATLIRDPGIVAAWFGLVCFALAAAGGFTILIMERRNR